MAIRPHSWVCQPSSQMWSRGGGSVPARPVPKHSAHLAVKVESVRLVTYILLLAFSPELRPATVHSFLKLTWVGVSRYLFMPNSQTSPFALKRILPSEMPIFWQWWQCLICWLVYMHFVKHETTVAKYSIINCRQSLSHCRYNWYLTYNSQDRYAGHGCNVISRRGKFLPFLCC